MSAEEKYQRPEPKLETLGDVERALARLAHRVDRKKYDIDRANCLRGILQALAAVKQDQRDNRYKKRVRVLWSAYQDREESEAVGVVPS
jgi:hypothetical protein